MFSAKRKWTQQFASRTHLYSALLILCCSPSSNPVSWRWPGKPQEQKWMLLTMGKWAAVQAPVQELTWNPGPYLPFLTDAWTNDGWMDRRMEVGGEREREFSFIYPWAFITPLHQVTQVQSWPLALQMNKDHGLIMDHSHPASTIQKLLFIRPNMNLQSRKRNLLYKPYYMQILPYWQSPHRDITKGISRKKVRICFNSHWIQNFSLPDMEIQWESSSIYQCIKWGCLVTHKDKNGRERNSLCFH